MGGEAPAPAAGRLRWSYVALTAPVAVLTPLVLSFAMLALLGGVADLFTASTRATADSTLAPLAGFGLGVGTIAAGVGIIALAVDVVRRPDGSGEAGTPRGPGAGVYLLVGAALGFVVTPLFVFLTADQFADTAKQDTPAGKYFTALAEFGPEASIGLSVGVVAGLLLVGWVVTTDRWQPIVERMRNVLSGWSADSDDGSRYRP
ncbi:MAG: hypothetical protein ACRD0U_07625 [Acidimicrobiales bacterium]